MYAMVDTANDGLVDVRRNGMVVPGLLTSMFTTSEVVVSTSSPSCGAAHAAATSVMLSKVCLAMDIVVFLSSGGPAMLPRAPGLWFRHFLNPRAAPPGQQAITTRTTFGARVR